jgi:FMN phosphatase YigB (HAD superfamily)
MPQTTLLLDLDDTLLDTNMEAFIPAYFSALSASLADVVAPEVMLPALMGGTRRMMASEDPAQTLREVFDAYFFPKLDSDRAALDGRINRFYDEVFPSLQYVTKPRPEAVEFVDWAFAAGYRVAVATNPYFPLKAVQHRMRWAGLPPEKYPFALVSSYETFHFTKETGAYFMEFLGQLGWPEGPAVMVGNDPDMDLVPAQHAGLPVFWMCEGKDESQPDIPQGSFNDLRRWLEETDPETLKPQVNTPDSILAVLRATPAALSTLTASLPLEAWSQAPAPGEWRLTEILCHLRDVEAEINLPRLQKMLREENPFLLGTDSDAWAQERLYAVQDGCAALKVLTEMRKETLSLLTGNPTQWTRTARHTFFGPTSVQELFGIVAGHDKAHIQQVWKTIQHG